MHNLLAYHRKSKTSSHTPSMIHENFDIDALLAQLTPAEKVSLLSGKDMWHTADIPRIGIPSIRLSDGASDTVAEPFCHHF